MKTYIVEPGNIAAVCYAYPKGEDRGEPLIYLAAGKFPVSSQGHTFRFERLPLSAKAAVNKHFYAVFALPVEKRGDYLKNCVPLEIDCADPCPFCHSTLGDDDGDPARCLNCGAA